MLSPKLQVRRQACAFAPFSAGRGDVTERAGLAAAAITSPTFGRDMNNRNTQPPEKDIDRTLEDTFPASDPPANGGQKTRAQRERRDVKKDAGQKSR